MFCGQVNLNVFVSVKTLTENIHVQILITHAQSLFVYATWKYKLKTTGMSPNFYLFYTVFHTHCRCHCLLLSSPQVFRMDATAVDNKEKHVTHFFPHFFRQT